MAMYLWVLLCLMLTIMMWPILHARRTARWIAAQKLDSQACSDASSSHLSVCCPGGGVFFWWQIGAMKRLLELYDLPSDVPLAGASAGALAIVLGQCGVDPSHAHSLAFDLADAAGVFSNPLGLCGKWGRLVDAWLGELLPADAAQRCTGRCRIAVTRLTPLPQAEAIDAYLTRASVIDALMASTHIPLFMDGRVTSARVQPAALDGGLLACLGLRSGLSLLVREAAHEAEAIVISHHKDAHFLRACRQHGWMPIRTKGTEQFASFGAAWVELEAERGREGEFARLEPYRRLEPPTRRGAKPSQVKPSQVKPSQSKSSGATSPAGRRHPRLPRSPCRSRPGS